MSSPSAAPPRATFIQLDVNRWRYAARGFGIALLNMMTLGLYKPYGLTRIRRALYNNLYIGKNPLHYAGTAQSLSRVSFYPSLAFLFLLLGPGGLQFYLDRTGIIILSGVQIVLLLAYAEYLRFLSLRYEMAQTSWRGLSFELGGSPFTYMGVALALQFANLLTLGLIAPWRRVLLARLTYGDMHLGAYPVQTSFSVKPLLLTYLPGWALSLAGFGYGSWYYWTSAIVPAVALWNGGAADPAMAQGIDPALFSGGMPVAAGSDVMAQIGTYFNVLSLFFIVFPLWQAWKIFCLAPYEVAWWKHFFSGLTVQGASPRFEGHWVELGVRTLISFICNFFTCNLTRPFTTYERLQYFVRNTVITGMDRLSTGPSS